MITLLIAQRSAAVDKNTQHQATPSLKVVVILMTKPFVIRVESSSRFPMMTSGEYGGLGLIYSDKPQEMADYQRRLSWDISIK